MNAKRLVLSRQVWFLALEKKNSKIFAKCEGIQIQELGIVESGIQENFACGIRNPGL